MQNPSKVLVHIFDLLNKKTLGLVYVPRRLNESLQPLSTKRGFNINKFEDPTWKDLRGRWEEMKDVIAMDREEQKKSSPNHPNYLCACGELHNNE
jgi:hypothetical protein